MPPVHNLVLTHDPLGLRGQKTLGHDQLVPDPLDLFNLKVKLKVKVKVKLKLKLKIW